MEVGVVATYLEHLQRQGHDAKSVQIRSCTFRQFGRFCDVLTATAEDIEAWLSSRPLAARSWNWYRSNLVCFYRYCIRQGLLETNPAELVPKRRTRRLVPRPMAQGDLEQAVAMAEPRMRVWLLLAAYAGLRSKEIAGLHRDDVMDSHDPPVLVVREGKGGHERVVPLHPDLLRALRVWGMPNRGWLFPGKDGHLRSTTVVQAINAYLHGLNISATGHQGRHYFATEVYRLSHDIRLTQELMGHASPQTTAIYAAWDQSAASDVVGGIGCRRSVISAGGS